MTSINEFLQLILYDKIDLVSTIIVEEEISLSDLKYHLEALQPDLMIPELDTKMLAIADNILGKYLYEK